MAEYDTEWNISGASVGSIVTLSKTERQVLRVGDTAAVFVPSNVWPSRSPTMMVRRLPSTSLWPPRMLGTPPARFLFSHPLLLRA